MCSPVSLAYSQEGQLEYRRAFHLGGLYLGLHVIYTIFVVSRDERLCIEKNEYYNGRYIRKLIYGPRATRASSMRDLSAASMT